MEYYDPEAALWPKGWVPPKFYEDKQRWRGIIVHHSAQESGSASDIHQAHLQRGWDGMGYDFVIDNGQGGIDGRIEVGYRWKRQETGAHCRPKDCEDNYWNEHTIGICLVGDLNEHPPTPGQWAGLVRLIDFLRNRYNIPVSHIIGHRDAKGAQTECPGKYMSLPKLRKEFEDQ